MASKTLQGLADLASSGSGLCVQDIPPNTIVRVTTENSLYEVLVVDPEANEVLVCGNHPRFPGPLRYNSGSHGDKAGPIAVVVGESLLLAHPAENRWFHTSTVKGVELVNDDKRVAEILARQDDPAKGVSAEEYWKQETEKDLATLSEEERQWAVEFLGNFPHHQAYCLILSVILAAQDAKRLPRAREVLQSTYDKHWHYHHPDRRGRLLGAKDVLRLDGVYGALGIKPPGKLQVETGE